MVAIIQTSEMHEKPIAFEVKKPIAVESIVNHPALQSTEVNYMKGAIIEGHPVRVGLFNPLTQDLIEEREGVLMEKGDGHVIVPFDSLNEVMTEVVEDVKEFAEKPQKEDGIFGFSYKQLLFLGAFTLIVSTVVKK